MRPFLCTLYVEGEVTQAVTAHPITVVARNRFIADTMAEREFARMGFVGRLINIVITEIEAWPT